MLMLNPCTTSSHRFGEQEKLASTRFVKVEVKVNQVTPAKEDKLINNQKQTAAVSPLNSLYLSLLLQGEETKSTEI